MNADRDGRGRFEQGHTLKFDRRPAGRARTILARMKWTVPPGADRYSVVPDGLTEVRVVVWSRSRKMLASWCVRQHGLSLVRAAVAMLRAADIRPLPAPKFWDGWVGR